MSENEEIILNGTPEESDNVDTPDNVQSTESQRNTDKILEGLAEAGASNEELLDSILRIPADQLIPWEECTLPSKGLYYGWPDGICEVKPLGQTAEKILATQRLASSGQAIDYLFRECCRFPKDFDPIDLLLGDRVFLLYFLRGITHGNLYEFAVTCPNNDCESVNTHVYDLNDLASTIKPANTSLGSEPFKIILPYLSKRTGREISVSVRFLRAYDANDMMAKKKSRNKFANKGGIKAKNRSADPRNQKSKNDSIDTTLDDNMERIIVNVMGVTDRFKIREFVQKMHGLDTSTVREWLKENTPGIDNTIEIICPDCGHEFNVELPITENFFRPAKQ